MRGRFTVRLVKAFYRSCSRFSRGESGAITVEFVMWIPFMLFFPLFVADTSFVFMRQASLLDISRDTARIVARHALDPEAAVQYAETRARQGMKNPHFSVGIDPEAGQVTVAILVDMHDLAPFGVLDLFVSTPMTIQAIYRLEPI